MVPMEIRINYLNKRLKEEVDLIRKNEETFSHTIVILYTKESHRKGDLDAVSRQGSSRSSGETRKKCWESSGFTEKTPYRSSLPPTQYRFSKLLWIKTLDSAGLHQHSANYGCSSPS